MPEETVERMSLLDALKIKRAKTAAEMTRKLKKMDRAINLLAASQAEQLVAEAAAVLAEE